VCVPEKEVLEEGQRQALKAEFLTIMQEKFLQGEDKTFDYRCAKSHLAHQHEFYGEKTKLDVYL